jgi:hypothetical protein
MKLVTLLITASFLAACAAEPSDEERVRSLIDSVEKAAEARDASNVLEHVADNYADSLGMDKAQLQSFLRGYFLAHPQLELLVGVESVEFPVDGLARAVVTITTVEFTDPGRQRLNVEFRRSGDDWQVVRADRLER